MNLEETTSLRLHMSLSDEDDSEGAEPLILDDDEDIKSDDFGEFVEDDDEEEEEEAADDFGPVKEEEEGKVSLEELREKEFGN